MQKELESLTDKLEEQGGVASAQVFLSYSQLVLYVMTFKFLFKVELNRKRENELTQIRKDFDAQNEENERTVADLRKKHAAAVTELEEKVDSLQKAKAKYVVSLIFSSTNQVMMFQIGKGASCIVFRPRRFGCTIGRTAKE